MAKQPPKRLRQIGEVPVSGQIRTDQESGPHNINEKVPLYEDPDGGTTGILGRDVAAAIERGKQKAGSRTQVGFSHIDPKAWDRIFKKKKPGKG